MNEKISNHLPSETQGVEDSRLSELLAALPREKASENFTARVLQRIEATPTQTPSNRWFISAPLLAAAALLLLALSFGGRELWHRHQHQEAVSRFEALRAEHAALELELRQLRRLAVKTRPVLYLGGNETVEYVVDLSRSHRSCKDASCTKFAHQAHGNLVLESPEETGETPNSSNVPLSSTASSEIETLSPAQLRQYPRRVY